MSIFTDARVWKVTAGPGCGKSYFIMKTIDGLLAEGVRLSEISYILFNRAPAQAFRRQLEAKGHNEEDMTWIGTHHAICRKLLKLGTKNILNTSKWGKEHGFDLSSEEKIKLDGIDEYGWDAVFSSLQRGIYEDRQVFTKEEQRLLDAFLETEESENKYTFIRFLQKAIKFDLFPVGVKYLFVDEAQDNGKLQFDWLQRIVDNRPSVLGIMLAGDDKQAINSFKGGNPELFLDFPCDMHVNLKTTYRLPLAILREANRIISPVKKRSELTSESAVEAPGQVIETQSLDDCIPDIEKALKQKKSVLVLLRNRCFEPRVRQTLSDSDILIQSEWSERLRRVLLALWAIRSTKMIVEDTLAAIVPEEDKQGMLKTDFYWQEGFAKKLRTLDFWTDRKMFDAYEEIRTNRGLPLERWEEIGMKPEFIRDIMFWRLDPAAVQLPDSTVYRFKDTLRRFGWGFGTVRVDTIHSVKGEEADVVVLVKNITEKTRQGEEDDEDAERRVWFVAASRAKETLLITNIPQSDKRTSIV